MKNLLAALICLSLSSAVFASAKCQKEVDAQNQGLGFDDTATPVDREVIIQKLNDDAFNAVDAELKSQLLEILGRNDVLTFTYGNDAGDYLSIAEDSDCTVIMNAQVNEI